LPYGLQNNYERHDEHCEPVSPDNHYVGSHQQIEHSPVDHHQVEHHPVEHHQVEHHHEPVTHYQEARHEPVHVEHRPLHDSQHYVRSSNISHQPHTHSSQHITAPKVTNHGASTYNLGEETKMIDGKLHKQVKEEKMEWDDKTNSQIKRIYIKYIPVDGEAHGHTQSHVPTSQPHVHNSHTHVTNSTPVTHNVVQRNVVSSDPHISNRQVETTHGEARVIRREAAPQQVTHSTGNPTGARTYTTSNTTSNPVTTVASDSGRRLVSTNVIQGTDSSNSTTRRVSSHTENPTTGNNVVVRRVNPDGTTTIQNPSTYTPGTTQSHTPGTTVTTQPRYTNHTGAPAQRLDIIQEEESFYNQRHSQATNPIDSNILTSELVNRHNYNRSGIQPNPTTVTHSQAFAPRFEQSSIQPGQNDETQVEFDRYY